MKYITPAFFFFFVFSFSSSALSEPEKAAFCKTATESVEELNRAYENWRIHSADETVPKSTGELIKKLIQEGWFHPSFFFRYSEDPVFFANKTFISSSPQPCLQEPEPGVDNLLPLLGSSSEYVRVYAIKNLAFSEIPDKKIPYVWNFLKNETDPEIFSHWLPLLLKENIYLFIKSLPEVSIPMISRVEKKTPLGYYLRFLCKMKLDIPPIPMVIDWMDEGYCFAFLTDIFSMHKDLQAQFAVPLIKGYGHQEQLLIRLMAHFFKNRECVKALLYCLENISTPRLIPLTKTLYEELEKIGSPSPWVQKEQAILWLKKLLN